MLKQATNNGGSATTVTQTKKTSTFTPSDQRELYRDALKQQSSNPFKLERVVNYDRMFTGPESQSFKFSTSNNYNPNYFPPKTFVKSGRNEPNIESTLSGPDRYKFFHRPVVGLVGEAEFLSRPMNEKHVVYVTDHPSQVDQDQGNASSEEEEIDIEQTPKTREMGTQSVYRESESQTMPYFPEVKPKSKKKEGLRHNNEMEGSSPTMGDDTHRDDMPEYMRMDGLFFEDGRNGGFITEDDIKIVDRARRRRNVESQIPKVGANLDSTEFKNRVQMLKDLEMVEWKEREEEVAKMQERQIEHVRAKLEVREQVREIKSSSRLEAKLKKIEDEAKEKLLKLEKKKLKNIRRTIKTHDNPENKLQKRDIILEYAFPGSKTYAPLLRDGQVSALTTIAYEIRPALLTDPLGVEEVQVYQVNKFLSKESKAVSLPVKDKDGSVVSTMNSNVDRKDKIVKEHLKLAIKDLEKLKTVSDIPDRVKEVKELYKSTPRIVRPPTPTLEIFEEAETNVEIDDLENAVVFIQKLMRGRAAQEEFYEGKERSIELIKELQAVEEIKQRERENEKSKIFKEQKRRQFLDQAREIVMDNLQGKLVSNALDFLSKELIRQEEVQRIKKLVEFAEKERSERESQETNRRKHEEEERIKKEKIQSETIYIHNDTVSTFLSTIFAECAEKLAHKQAQNDIIKERTTENALQNRSLVTPEESHIKDLVRSFLLPQVKRELLKKQIDINQNKFINSAHSSLFSVLSDKL